MPAPLFWHIGLLALISGIVASRWPIPGAACAGLLLVAALPAFPRHVRSIRAGLLLLFLGAGLTLGMGTQPPSYESLIPAMPPWFKPAVSMRLQGKIEHVSGQPDRRLRILLSNVRPAPPSDKQSQPTTALPNASLPGFINLSWDQGSKPDTPRPLPGQTITLTTRLMPITGFANEGGADSTRYWAARGVWLNAWTASNLKPETLPIVTGSPTGFSASREHLRAELVAALGGSTPGKSAWDKKPAKATNPKKLGPQQSEEYQQTEQSMSQARAIIPALLFGDRYGLDSQTLDLFVQANLVHSLALSGQHLALAALTAAFLAWVLGWCSTRLLLARRTVMLSLCLPLALVYLWVGNSPLSLIRAALMMGFGLLLWLRKRPSTLLDLLFMASACLVLAWPQAVFDLSVQLSVLSVAGIALAAPLLSRVRHMPAPALPHSILKGAALLLLTSVAVQISTLPVLLSTFGRVSPLFPLNLLWLPVLELLVLPLAALGTLLVSLFGAQPVSDLLFLIAVWPANTLIKLLVFLREHDFLTVWQGLKPTGLSSAGYAAAVLASAIALGKNLASHHREYSSPKVRSVSVPGVALRLALCAAILLPLGAVEREINTMLALWRKQVSLRVLDVGQGQALVLEWPQGRLLLDGGGSTSPRFDPGRDIVAHALTANRPPRLSMVMASHADMDHARGLQAIVDMFDIESLAYSVAPFTSASHSGQHLEDIRRLRGIPLHRLKAGDIINLTPYLRLEILHPPQGGRRLSSNNSSLIVRVARLEQKQWHGLALLCGDAQNPALRTLLRFSKKGGLNDQKIIQNQVIIPPPNKGETPLSPSQTPKPTWPGIHAEALVIPHHGSRTSLLPEFYSAAAPRFALISRGFYNHFGFPDPDVLKALQKHNVSTLDTALHGEIRITWLPGKDASVQTLRHNPLP